MFPFIDVTWNPLGGGHVIMRDKTIRGCYNCIYCWARGLIDQNPIISGKYLGRYRVDEKQILKRFKEENFCFACTMADIGHPSIPRHMVLEILRAVRRQPCKVLLLTKNPSFFIDYQRWIPKNAVLGATIETDLTYFQEESIFYRDISKAPTTDVRLEVMMEVKEKLPNWRFISIEPIMKFSSPIQFARKIIDIEPEAVAIGYDNYDNHLPEPTRQETEALNDEIEDEAVILIYQKTIREAWNEDERT